MTDRQAQCKNIHLWTLFVENCRLQKGDGWQWKVLDSLIEKRLPYPDVAKNQQTEWVSIGDTCVAITVLDTLQVQRSCY